MTVVWWTADSPLFESIVHPGPDEAFVALYPQWPADDQRARRVAVVDKANLPTASGVAMGVVEGTDVTVWSNGEPQTLDVSTTAPERTRTPPWDLMPRNRWIWSPPPSAFGQWFRGLGRLSRIAFTVAVVSAVTFVRVGTSPSGGLREALSLTAIVAAITVAAMLASWLVDWSIPGEGGETRPDRHPPPPRGRR